ncbi:hypothetical protein BC830DRAFT_1143588 [Chytriomyces sp. MP71]|nr:hypothetical protein BC830DRAFT_1143588 [Chytriomyces sp. MP71]
MQAWSRIKASVLQNSNIDATFGPQQKPTTPTLSLLVFLDASNPPHDLYEFLLDLAGTSWCLATLVLLGYEGCPHFHATVSEVLTLTQCNARVGVFEAQGRICERIVVEAVLKSVFPMDPPESDEILGWQFELTD